MRRLLIIGAVAMFGTTAIPTTATAGTGTMTLSPNIILAASTLSVSVTAAPGFSGLPSSIALVLQPGFASSIKSVTTLCTPAQSTANSCPAASMIGGGSVVVSFFGIPQPAVPVTLHLGSPLQPGDIASVMLNGSASGGSLSASGRLFAPAQGGLELLLTSSSLTTLPVTFVSLSISVHASQSIVTTTSRTVTKIVFRGKGKHRRKHKIKVKVKKASTAVYSLFTNPSACTGKWTGTASMIYPSGTDTTALSAACTV